MKISTLVLSTFFLSSGAFANNDCTVYVQSKQKLNSTTPTIRDVANYQRQIAVEAKLKSSLRKNNFELTSLSEARFLITEHYALCQIDGLDELTWEGGTQEKPFHWVNPVDEKCDFSAAEINLFDKVKGKNQNFKAKAEKGVFSKPNVMTALNIVLKQLPECNE